MEKKLGIKITNIKPVSDLKALSSRKNSILFQWKQWKNLMPQENKKQVRILIVDDEPVMRRALARPLRGKEGCAVTEAQNGAEALEMLKKDCNFDLVILDLFMPKMGGASLVEELAGLGMQNIVDRIVIHSGTILDDMTPRAQELVAGRLLPKPHEIGDLIELLECAKEGRVKEWRPART